MNTITRAALVLLAAASFTAAGCGDNPTDTSTAPDATEDAAVSVADAMGQENGGAFDQMTDLSSLASPQGFSAMATASVPGDALAKSATPPTVDTSYDAATGTWTVSVSRTRGTVGSEFYAAVTRVYQVQFLNSEGEPQRSWRVVNPDNTVDTARSISFTIVSGSGEHHTPRVSQQLTSISGSWTATGVNTDTISINGSYSRSAVDTITKANAVRTLNHTLNLTVTNVQVPRIDRGRGLDLVWRQATGTASGTYHADVEFTRGDTYKEKTIDRSFTTTFSDGAARLNILGRAFHAGLVRGQIDG